MLRLDRMRGLVFAAAILLGLAALACAVSKPAPEELGAELNILNWESYFAESTLPDFEKEYGIKVNLETFDGEDSMLSLVQSQPDRYDVVITSGSMVQTLVALKLLSPLNLKRIPNFANIEGGFLGLPYDPKNDYSVPYLWGTTGIAYNSRLIPEEIASWQALWDSRYAGHIAMLNDVQEVMAAALKSLGYSINSTHPAQLEEAGRILKEQRPLIAGYWDPMTIVEGLRSGDIWIAQLYNGDTFFAAADNPDITYAVPEEGVALWVDNLVVPVDARHKAAAEAFINYILQPRVIADIANYLYYATPNKLAGEFIQAEIQDDPAIYPPPEVIARSETFRPLGAEANRIVNRIWAELQAPR